MKNFAFALVTFLVWALIGFGIHTYFHSQKTQPVEVILPKTEVSLKDTLNKNGIAKDSISKIIPEFTVPKKIIYLGFDIKDFKETQNIDNYIKSLKKYIKINKLAQIYIVGFTDDIGEETANYWIGSERANNFKLFLISKGIEKERIHTSSKGETSPITKNNSLESRRKNRRIEITVKPN